MELKVDPERLRWLENLGLPRTDIKVEAIHDGELGDYDIAALTERSLRDWTRQTAGGDHSAYEGIIVRLLVHKFESLTLEDFTAENALLALNHSREISGLHSPERPWGGQCTAILPNGIPVDNSGFPRAVLAVLAGQSDGSEYLARWRADVMKARGMAIVDSDDDYHWPKGRELTELMEMRKKRQYDEAVEGSYPRDVAMAWWVVRVKLGESGSYHEIVIESGSEPDVEDIVGSIINPDWKIESIIAFEKWCK